MRLAAYIRCSTVEQEDSPDVQRRAIESWLSRDGHDVVGWYEDSGVSGGLPLANRPAAARMLQDSRGFDGIIALRLDRFSRNLADLLHFTRSLQKRKLRLFFVTESFDDSPAGNLTFSILGAIAQFEREQTGRRIHEHNSWLAAQGKWPSGYAPIGLFYNPQTKQVETTDRAPDVTRIFAAYIEHSGNWRATARYLNHSGILTARGNPWTIRALQVVIRNCAYLGRIYYSGQEYDTDLIPDIVDRDLVEQAQALAVVTHNTRGRSGRTYAYTSILRCLRCGSRYIVHTGGRVMGTARPWIQYRCGRRAQSCACDSRPIAESRLHIYVAPVLEELLAGYELPSPEEPRVTVNTNRLKASRSRLIDLYTSGIISREELEPRLAEIDAQLVDNPAHVQPVIPASALQEYAQEFADHWREWSAADQRAFLLAVCPEIGIDHHQQALRLVFRSPLLAEPLARDWTVQRSRYRSCR